MSDITTNAAPDAQVAQIENRAKPVDGRPFGVRAVEWGRENLFYPWYNAIITVIIAFGLAWAIWAIFDWAVLRAIWTPTYNDEGVAISDACRVEGVGACWAFVREKFNFILFGLFPGAHDAPEEATNAVSALFGTERWRPTFTIFILVGALIATAVPTIRRLRLSAVAAMGCVAGLTALWIIGIALGNALPEPYDFEGSSFLPVAFNDLIFPAKLVLTLGTIGLGVTAAVMLGDRRRRGGRVEMLALAAVVLLGLVYSPAWLRDVVDLFWAIAAAVTSNGTLQLIIALPMFYGLYKLGRALGIPAIVVAVGAALLASSAGTDVAREMMIFLAVVAAPIWCLLRAKGQTVPTAAVLWVAGLFLFLLYFYNSLILTDGQVEISLAVASYLNSLMVIGAPALGAATLYAVFTLMPSEQRQSTNLVVSITALFLIGYVIANLLLGLFLGGAGTEEVAGDAAAAAEGAAEAGNPFLHAILAIVIGFGLIFSTQQNLKRAALYTAAFAVPFFLLRAVLSGVIAAGEAETALTPQDWADRLAPVGGFLAIIMVALLVRLLWQLTAVLGSEKASLRCSLVAGIGLLTLYWINSFGWLPDLGVGTDLVDILLGVAVMVATIAAPFLLVMSFSNGSQTPFVLPLWITALAAIGILMAGGIFALEPVGTLRWGGLPLTLMLTLVGLGVAFPIGVLLALGRRSKLPFIRGFCISYIEVIRGVPLITLLVMASVMFPLFLPEGVSINGLLRTQIALIMFASAYMAEVVRGGLQSIPKGQYEAADSLGLSYWQKTQKIILPQALGVSIPPIVNTVLSFFKDTSLVIIVGQYDLLNTAKTALTDREWTGFSIEAYLFIAGIYFIFCYAMSKYSQYLERELGKSRRR